MIITKADKGNTIIILKKRKYIKTKEEFIEEGPYKSVSYDYTSKYQAHIKKVLMQTKFLSKKPKKLLKNLIRRHRDLRVN